MSDLTQVDPVLQHLIQGSAGEGLATRDVPGSTRPYLAADAVLLEVFLKFRYTS